MSDGEHIVEPEDVLLPPLLIELGLTKYFIITLYQDFEAIQYLVVFSTKLSQAKVKANIFVGSPI